MTSPWNSLEVAKLVMGLLTPAAIALLGIYVHHVSKRYEEAQWKSQKLIEKRLAIYDEIAPSLNDLLCYFTYIGCWKDLTPIAVIKLKRQLDRKIFLAAPLFPPAFLDACKRFQNSCFKTYGGWGSDPLLRTQFGRRKDAAQKNWLIEDDTRFVSDAVEVTPPEKIQEGYAQVMREFTAAFGMPCAEETLATGHAPDDVR